MKIVFVSHTVYPDFIGGREHHLHHLARSLAADHDVVVIGGGNVRCAVETKTDGYRLLRLPMFSITLSRNPLQIYRFIPQLNCVLENEQPDVVHAFEYGSQSTDAAFRYAQKRGLPFFITVYGYVLKSPFLSLAKNIYDVLWGRFVLRGSRRIYCVSSAPYEEVRRILRRMPSCGRKAEILLNGITTGDFKSIMQKEDIGVCCYPGPEVKLVTISRLLPRKNISTVIRALHQIVYGSSVRNVRLCVIGPDCGEMEKIKKLVFLLRLEAFVEFAGPVPYERIRGLLEKNDIFVLPSYYEGVPLALLEAMACGKAVVFSDIPASYGLISDGVDGILVRPDDFSGLAAALERLIRDVSYRYALGKKAQAKAADFDISYEKDKIARHYSEAFGA